VSLVLVTRQGCHLCDEALGLDRLHDLYDWRVPVLLLDDRVVAEGRLTEELLVKTVGKGAG